ncbi:glucosaminidase domain-containing protein [Pareuzebyella sediminis]|uniref:glucosaminidase domain-containing protein n=1 Tax=Pareuzebyella sediminis TaxID=2607998 RepID=UPI0011EEEF7C|nr:glucosaminidase domain-containing protein [Pareuzebyella sediminis]
MTRQIGLLFLLGIVLIGCKTKRTVSNNNNRENYASSSETVTVVKSKSTHEVGDSYTMPKDTGKFVRLAIESPQEYIEVFSEIAQLEMKAYGIPASITLAQGLLESGFGKGALALKTNNHFGIKCHTGWQGEYDFHDDDEKGECFRKYNHPMYSYRDHSIFLSGRSRYAFLFDLPNDDYKAWAKGLRKAGYATDRHYPQKLIGLIERYQLHKFDEAVATKGYGRSPQKNVVMASSPLVSTHTVKQGDTLYSISKRYSVSVDDLMRWNYMYDSHISVGQELTVKTQNFN